MRLGKFLLFGLFAALLSACTVDSDEALFGPSAGHRPLPSQALVLAPNEAYGLQGNGGGYDFAKNDTYANATFIPLGEDAAGFFIAQIKKAAGGYTYALVDGDASGARRWPFAASDYAERLGIAATASEEGIKIERREDLLALYRLAHAERDPSSAIAFRVFDMADERQRTAGLAYLEELSAEQDTATSPAAAPPSEAGNWVYREEIDAFDDSRKQFLFGKPIEVQGAQAEPYIRIGCYADGMGITLFWGNVMADAYPNAEMDFVNVAVRFDAGEVYQLGWAASEDWTATYPPSELSGALAQLGNGFLNGMLPELVDQVNTTWDAKQFHFSLMASDRVALRASSRTGAGAVTLAFDLSGYRKVAQNFRPSCL